jgi:hypothetical protein
MLRPALALACLLGAALPASAMQWSPPEYAGMLADPELAEVSGLAASHAQPGRYWSNNDGDNGAALQLIDVDGTRVASIVIAGASNTDWEDIASFRLDGRNYVLVADTGDNGGIRSSLTLHVIEEPAKPKDGDRVPLAWTIEFKWPDGARDCEAVAVDAARGEVLLVSKKRVPPELFRVPLRPKDGPVTAERIGTLSGITQPREEELRRNPVYGRYRSQVTGADLSPNGRVLAVLNYTRIYFFTRPEGSSAWTPELLSRAGALDFPWLPQAEAIAFSADGTTILIGGEQRPSPLLLFRIKPRD